MGLVTCKECNKQVSSLAKTCPGCGAPVSKFTAKTFLIGCLFPLVLFAAIIASCNHQQQKKDNTPEALEKRKREDQVIFFAKAVKDYLRDPESLEFIKAISNQDASTVCMLYRARNGFGGMTVEKVVFQDKLPMQDDESWSKYCPKKDMIIDVTSIANIVT